MEESTRIEIVKRGEEGRSQCEREGTNEGNNEGIEKGTKGKREGSSVCNITRAFQATNEKQRNRN